MTRANKSPTKQPGSLEVICGCMFSGKSEELLRRIRRSLIAKQQVAVFKPTIDSRYHKTDIASHSGATGEAQVVIDPEEILEKMDAACTVVAIDEVQFFPDSVVRVIEQLISRGCRVIVAGLDTDFLGRPFGSMPTLLAEADSVTKLTAVCVVCGEAATRSQCLINGRPAAATDPLIVVGAAEQYEARCREHHRVG